MIRIVVALLMLGSAALAQTAPKVMAVGAFDADRSISFSAFPTDAKDGLNLYSFYNAKNVNKVIVRTNASVLATCLNTGICNYFWPKTDMVSRQCVQCPVTVIATDSTGRTFRIDTIVLRP